jgi:hypothetical protein
MKKRVPAQCSNGIVHHFAPALLRSVSGWKNRRQQQRGNEENRGLPSHSDSMIARAPTSPKRMLSRTSLTISSRNLYRWRMEVHFSPDVETRLQQVASASGKNAEQLVKDTVNRMPENQARFIAGVHAGVHKVLSRPTATSW